VLCAVGLHTDRGANRWKLSAHQCWHRTRWVEDLGSLVTPYADTAFGIPTAEGKVKHWELMPTGLDILITHGPPVEVLDCALDQTFHGGCPQLRDAVVRKHPRLHVFGHVHGGYGTLPTLE
jgi:Icc-related predicted phosphoesterase